ncbi:MAG: GNAT family N-acetyltransferase [Bacilli bacterium]|nr:GNAT family N-acetyltransferase [Bacilli bacterium]
MIEEIKDIKLIENLFKEYKEKYNPIINDYTFILSYKENDKYVGFLIYQLLYEACEIIDIFVLDEYRNKGIGKALINKMLENKQIEKVTLEVKKDNKKAIMLYNSLGFKPVSIRKGYYEGVDAILMLKEVK